MDLSPQSIPEPFRQGMQRISRLVRDRGDVPIEFEELIAQLDALWNSDGPIDQTTLKYARVRIWRFLEAKNGNSSTIADHEDRTLRAALGLTETPPVEVQDCEEWAVDMLGT